MIPPNSKEWFMKPENVFIVMGQWRTQTENVNMWKQPRTTWHHEQREKGRVRMER